jgi:hypothetical protein
LSVGHFDEEGRRNHMAGISQVKKNKKIKKKK